MLRVKTLATIVLLPALASLGASGPSRDGHSQAVGSLLHSAADLYYSPAAPARAARLLAIGQYLGAMAPDDPRVQRLLADIDQCQDDFAKAAAAAKKLIDAAPDDYASALRWLRFRLAMLNSAPDRVDLLKNLLDRSELSAPLRSAMAGELARLYVGQGARSDAQNALERALKLDPLNHTALISRLELAEKPTARLRVRTLLSLLEGNPRAWWVARELGGELGAVGLHEQALKFYRHAWNLRYARRPVGDAPADFAVEYLSALLDAGHAAQAVRYFAPAADRLNGEGEFLSLLAEAYRKTGNENQAGLLLRTVEHQYRAKLQGSRIEEGLDKPTFEKKTGKMTAELAVHLGWFYLLSEPRPLRARQYARQARQLGASGEMIDLLDGAAELAIGIKQGLERLRPLMKKYPFAAAFMARHYYKNGDDKAARDALLAGLGGPRKGLAYRMLAELARKHNVAIPPADGVQAARELIKGFDERILRMGLEPEKFLSITLQPIQPAVGLCEPVSLAATLKNVGEIPIPIGQWGLLTSRLGLEVVARGGKAFPSVPVIIFPAPRYLRPGQSVTAQTRLDSGPIGRYLAGHPIKAVDLEVRGVASPRERKNRVVSGLAMVKPAGVTIRRLGLMSLGADSARVSTVHYNAAMRSIGQSLRGGRPADRMLAARRIAALLGWLQRVQLGKARIPGAIRPVAKIKPLFDLMRRALKDNTPAVRAEMVAALNYANLTGETLNELGCVIEDVSPLVRFRVVELLGASGLKANRKIIEFYAGDKNRFVAMMARAFGPRPKPEKNRPGGAKSTLPATQPAPPDRRTP